MKTFSKQNTQNSHYPVFKLLITQKTAKNALFVKLAFSLLNLVWIGLLLLRIVPLPLFIQSQKNCPHTFRYLVYLDLYLTFSSLLLCFYLLNNVKIQNVNNHNSMDYFKCYLLIWLSVKITYVIFYKNDKNCFFTNLNDLPINFFPRSLSWIVYWYLLSFLVLVGFYKNLECFFDLQSKMLFEFIQYN